jgi:hypothetical protein
MLMCSTDRCRRQDHNAAWYDSPSDEPSNLPIALRNPFGKRKSTASTRNYNDLHVQEAGEIDSRTLRPVRTNGQDYRYTTSQDRARELGLDHGKTEGPLDGQKSESPPLIEKPEIRVIPPPRSASAPIAQVESESESRLFGIELCDSPVAAHDITRPIPDIPSKPLCQQPPCKSSPAPSDTYVEAVSGPTLVAQIRAVLFGSWLNILLLMIPAGFAVQLTNGNPALIFSLNFIAIIPLGRILSLATKDLVLRLGGLPATAVIMTFG